MQKNILRKQYLAKRRQCSLEVVKDGSEKICDRFFGNFKPEATQTIHVFLPILKNCEINTWLIIKKLWQDFPEVQVAVPVTNFETEELEHYLLTPQTGIQESSWGIPEPVNATPIAETDIDVVLLPLIAFDLQGHRVGYGKGYYDRFLNRCRPDVVKIGLSLFPPVDLISDVHEGDIPLNHCITPEEQYRF